MEYCARQIEPELGFEGEKTTPRVAAQEKK
jgi:hypothetical protein